MAETAVAADGGKALHVRRHLTAEVALDDVPLFARDRGEAVDLLLVQVPGAAVRIETRNLDDLAGPRRPDTVDVAQGVGDFLVGGNIGSENAWHGEKWVDPAGTRENRGK
jgi:hypothetical protein